MKDLDLPEEFFKVDCTVAILVNISDQLPNLFLLGLKAKCPARRYQRLERKACINGSGSRLAFQGLLFIHCRSGIMFDPHTGDPTAWQPSALWRQLSQSCLCQTGQKLPCKGDNARDLAEQNKFTVGSS